MKLIKLTDQFMTRQKIFMPTKASWYPSEASVEWTDSRGEKHVEGTCHRAAFFRYTNRFADLEFHNSPYTEWIFALGKAVEEILVKQYKEMGIWVDNNKKFYDEKRNISGEVDVIVRDPETNQLVGLEIKSVAGYNAGKQVFGNGRTPAAPKTSQLLQTLIYVDQFKELVPYFKMIYYSRDTADRIEFDIDLLENSDGKHHPTINRVVDYRFTLEDIYSRFDKLNHYVAAGIVPPPDYELAWSDEKVERRMKAGEVGKTNYAAWKKNRAKNPIGDWNCQNTYCRYSDFCWGKKSYLLGEK